MDAENSGDITPASAAGSTSGGAGEKSASSMRRSCEACRNSKAKCQPSNIDRTKCQRFEAYLPSNDCSVTDDAEDV